MSIVENRYDFVIFFDCQDGNPNGDPDADNSPRVDPETFQGLVSDVCLKRKIRDYVYQTQGGESVRKGYDVFVLSPHTLESRQRQPFDNLKGEIVAAREKTKAGDVEKAREWMCENFFDIRTFGAVMSTTDFNCGQVRGPAQLTFARSIDRILTTEHAITRQAFTTEKEKNAKPGAPGTIGRKHTIAYGLYRAYGFINPMFADKTGFSDEDLQMLWKALCNMFDLDRSAARGLMSTRGLYIFKHDSKLGSAPAQQLFESIKVERKPGVESPRSFSDYTITPPNKDSLPTGIELIQGCPLA